MFGLENEGFNMVENSSDFYVILDPPSELRGATSEVRSEARFRIYLKFYVKYVSAEVRRHLEVQSNLLSILVNRVNYLFR